MTTARFNSIRLKVMCVALVAAYPTLAEAGVAGRVQFVAGDVRVVDDKGKTRPMQKGQEVNEGDTVLSGANGSAQLKMVDGALVAVRPSTELKVIDYVFDAKDSSKESASFSLVKGGLRAITGLIGKANKDKYKIETPTATIGIRGTDHEPVVVLPGASAGVPPGTYDKVNVGATTLTTQGGTAVIGANQVGYAASPTEAPIVLPKVPDFFRATPAPRQQGKKQEEQKKEQNRAEAPSQTSEQTASTSNADSDASSSTSNNASTSSSNTGTGTTTSNVNSSTTNVNAGSTIGTNPTVVTTTTPVTSLTAVDVNGNALNLSEQTLTTTSGQLVNLSDETSTTALQNQLPHTYVIAAFPGKIVGSPGMTDIPYPDVYFFDGPSPMVVRDAAGHITAVNGISADVDGYRSSLSQSGATLTDFKSDAATSLSWGRWQGGQVTRKNQYFGTDENGSWGMGAFNEGGSFIIGGIDTYTMSLGNGSLHWIAGKEPGPDYLPRILTGSADYTLIGGTRPTDQNGNLGTLNSASLNVNFTNQTAKAAVNFSINGNTWNMTSGNMLLDDAEFSSYNGCDGNCASNVSLTKNGAPVNTVGTPSAGFAIGSMNGFLAGAGLNGAALQYAVQDEVAITAPDNTTTFSHNVIQGVAAFSGPTQDTNTPFRAVGVNDGWGGGPDAIEDDIEMSAEAFYHGSVDGGEAPVARVVDGPSGLTEFVGSASGYTPVGTPSFISTDIDVPATIKIGSAVNRDVGSTTIAGTTVSWGRWEGGNIDIYSRDGSVKLGTIDNSERSIHWITSSALTNTSFSNLPLTGSATYTVAGHTNPTDFKGNVGVLNSATLSADFTNAKVNAGINVSFNAPSNTSNWTMTATNIPLGGKDGFGSSTALHGTNGITHTATCTGPSCGTQTVGRIGGIFFNGAQGAAVTYGMATGTGSPSSTFTPTNAVTGVVIMKR